MAYFDYTKTHTQKVLYDWVLAEQALAQRMGLRSFARLLDNYQKLLNRSHANKTGLSLWVPSLPDDETIYTIQRRMLRSSKKIVYELEKEIETTDQTPTDIMYEGSSGKCPECGSMKTHLKDHLKSKRHNWTDEMFRQWKASKPRVQQLPNKYCHFIDKDGSACAWTGTRIDMHLHRTHGLGSHTSEYRRLRALGRTPRSSSTTVNSPQPQGSTSTPQVSETL